MLEGHHLLIQIFVGGMTQFLTRAQGMPAAVEKHLEHIIKNFGWDNEGKVPVNTTIMYAPKEMGGMQILDIQMRNQAIVIMRLKSYLCLNESRPAAAYVTDAIVNRHIKDPRVHSKAVANTFLQTWSINTQSNSQLPKHTAEMLQLAKKLNVQLEMAAPRKTVQVQIPIWYHIGGTKASQRRYRTLSGGYLMNNHEVELTGDALKVSERLTKWTHKPRKDCKCDECKEDHLAQGCANPHKCAVMARQLLDRLQLKWDPREHVDDNGLQLNKLQVQQNWEAKKSKGIIRFDPTMDGTDDLADGFRIFTSGWDQSTRPARRAITNGNPRIEEIEVAYTDGSGIHNGTASARAGAGVWYGDNDPRNRAVRIKGTRQTNNVGEL